MSKRIDILIKSVTLLHREAELNDASNDNSSDLVSTILGYFNRPTNKNQLLGGDSTIISDLKYLLKDMIDNPDNYEKNTLLQSLEIVLKDKPSLITVIDKTINVELDKSSLKRTIISLRNTLNNFYKEEELKNAVSKASYSLNTNNIGSDSISEYIGKLVVNLEALTNTTKSKDPGIVDELDISDTDHIAATMDEVKKESTAGGKLQCGWKAINKMTSGGFRKGEQWVVSALQHNYKSGFVQSLFAQLSMYNKPELKDPSKKPLNLLISFEDDMNIVTGFIYKYLYFNEFKELPNMTEITGKEIGAYITKKLTVTGYHVKIIRVNPSEWTYKHLFNKILAYEAEGYELHTLIVDYLSKLPTTGCITSGPMGTDVRDLFNRARNFCSS